MTKRIPAVRQDGGDGGRQPLQAAQSTRPVDDAQHADSAIEHPEDDPVVAEIDLAHILVPIPGTTRAAFGPNAASAAFVTRRATHRSAASRLSRAMYSSMSTRSSSALGAHSTCSATPRLREMGQCFIGRVHALRRALLPSRTSSRTYSSYCASLSVATSSGVWKRGRRVMIKC